jgi:hypothetical protein
MPKFRGFVVLMRQSEFARKIGKSRQYVHKLVKKGIIPLRDGKFIDHDEAVRLIEEYSDPHRQRQREINEKKRLAKKLPSDKACSIFDLEGAYESIADMTEEEKERKRNELRKLQEQAKSSGVEVVGQRIDVEDLDVKELNRLILQQELRLKTAKADEAEKKVVPIDEVQRVFFSATRIIRDGMMAIAPRLAARLAATDDPHVCRTMLEEEIVGQLEGITGAISELGTD